MKIVNNWPKMTFFDQNMDSNEMGFLIESPTCFCFHKIATRFPANPLVLSSIRANKFLSSFLGKPDVFITFLFQEKNSQKHEIFRIKKIVTTIFKKNCLFI